MTGKVIEVDIAYPDYVRAQLTQFPVDEWNRQLASLADDAGITHVFDPAYVTKDLATTASWAVVGSLSNNTINGQPVKHFTTTPATSVTLSKNKAESSWSIMAFFHQTSGDQAAAANKVLVACGQSNFYLRNQSGGSTWNANFNGTNKTGFTLGAGSYLMTIQFDADSKIYTIRNNDTILISESVSAVPASNAPWDIGWTGSGSSFTGDIGEVVFFDNALSDDALRQNLQAILRDKYGI